MFISLKKMFIRIEITCFQRIKHVYKRNKKNLEVFFRVSYLYDTRLNLMLLLELTSISVVVAARQKRQLRSLDLKVLERYHWVDASAGNLVMEIKKLADQTDRGLRPKVKNRGKLRFTLVKATGLVSNFCCFLFLQTCKDFYNAYRSFYVQHIKRLLTSLHTTQ